MLTVMLTVTLAWMLIWNNDRIAHLGRNVPKGKSFVSISSVI